MPLTAASRDGAIERRERAAHLPRETQQVEIGQLTVTASRVHHE